MSARIIKKIAEKYKSNENEADINEAITKIDYPISTRKKFDLILSDSSNDENHDSSFIQEIETKKVKSKKKKKSKAKIKDDILDITEEELMEQFANSNNDINNQKLAMKMNDKFDILQVKIRLLNEQAELEQMFGGNSSNESRTRQQYLVSKFAVFGKRENNWPMLASSKLGLCMKLDETNPINQLHTQQYPKPNNTEYFLVTEPTGDDYLIGEQELAIAIRTGHINLQQLLTNRPYHCNTLLYVASILFNQEDFSLAADCWKRIFHLYQSIIPNDIAILRTNSKEFNSYCCLDYKYRLNRPLFLALFQWILHLCHKSCFNTALEYCKLLFGLNSQMDPLGVILLIDDIALRCNQYDFLIELFEQFNSSKSLEFLPNFAFSISLCYFYKYHKNNSENFHSKANDCLRQALMKFPQFLIKYCDLGQIQLDENVSSSIWFSSASSLNSPNSLDVLLNLYFKRSVNLWKNESVLQWLQANCTYLADHPPDPASQERNKINTMYKHQLPMPIQRHVAISNHGELLRRDLNDSNYLIFDPLPPLNSVGGFDHYSTNFVEQNLSNRWWINLYNSLFPSFR